MTGSVQETPATPSPFHETSRVFSNSREEKIIIQPLLNPLPKSNASPPLHKFPSATSQARLDSVPRQRFM